MNKTLTPLIEVARNIATALGPDYRVEMLFDHYARIIGGPVPFGICRNGYGRTAGPHLRHPEAPA